MSKKIFTQSILLCQCTTTNIKRILSICIVIYKGKWTLTMLCLLPYFKRESMRKFVYLLEREKLAYQYFILVLQGIKITLAKMKMKISVLLAKNNHFQSSLVKKYIFKQLLVFKFCCMLSIRYILLRQESKKCEFPRSIFSPFLLLLDFWPWLPDFAWFEWPI